MGHRQSHYEAAENGWWARSNDGEFGSLSKKLAQDFKF
jgi:hypothetical protein